MTYVALGLAVLAMLMAWYGNRRNKALNERIERLDTRIYNLRQETQETQEHAREEMQSLKYQVMKFQGNLKVTEDMTIEQITDLHPQAVDVLAAFHIGGCSSCVVDGSERLEEAAISGGRPVEPILIALNSLVAENGGQPISVEMLKGPNVELML